MKFWLKLLSGVVLIFVGIVVLTHLLGLVFWIAIIAAFVSCLVGLIGYGIRQRQQRKLPQRLESRTEKAANRALKEMERKANKS